MPTDAGAAVRALRGPATWTFFAGWSRASPDIMDIDEIHETIEDGGVAFAAVLQGYEDAQVQSVFYPQAKLKMDKDNY